MLFDFNGCCVGLLVGDRGCGVVSDKFGNDVLDAGLVLELAVVTKSAVGEVSAWHRDGAWHAWASGLSILVVGWAHATIVEPVAIDIRAGEASWLLGTLGVEEAALIAIFAVGNELADGSHGSSHTTTKTWVGGKASLNTLRLLVLWSSSTLARKIIFPPSVVVVLGVTTLVLLFSAAGKAASVLSASSEVIAVVGASEVIDVVDTIVTVG